MVLQYITSILLVRALHCATSRSTLEVKDTIMKQKLIALSFAAALALATGVAFAPQAMAAPTNNTNSTNNTNNNGQKTTTNNGQHCVILTAFCSDSVLKDANSGTSNNAIMKLLKWAIGILTVLVGIVAVGAIVFAGILYSSASGNAGQVEKAKSLIFNTVIGLVAYGLMFFVVNWLVPGGVLG
jgi:hypothetical protein